MKNIFVFTLSVIILTSCNIFNKYKGFSKTDTGIYYNLNKIGEHEKKIKATDFATIDVSYSTIDDSVFFKGQRTFQLTEPEFEGSIDECFLMLYEGDSTTFIIDANDFFTKTLKTKLPHFFKRGDDLKVRIRLDEIRTQEQYEKDKEDFLKWIEDFGEYEKTVLRRFITEEKIDVAPMDNGMYYISLFEGTGKPVENGDLVTINYEGRFLNGKFFDSTIKRQQPLEFVYGSEMQVIPGMEMAIGRMREGEKALIILPSELAWGEKGSSTGIIPPFTSVIYEIELIKAEHRGFDD
jgi:FKBP-type peptidyl-prolyl cis-trans isomerase